MPWRLFKRAPQPRNRDVPPLPIVNAGETVLPAKTDDLWTKAREKLSEDKHMRLILEEAAKIVGASGLDIESHGAKDSQQLHDSLDVKVKELEKRALVFQFNDHSIKVREQLGRVIRNILVLKDLVSSAASSSPPAAIVCASITFSLTLFIRAEDQDSELLNGLEKISGMLPRLQMMENLYLPYHANLSGNFMEKFQEALVLLYCKILEFQARALCFLEKNTARRFYNNLIHEKWDTLAKSIESQETEVQKSTWLLNAAQRQQDTEKITNHIQKALEKHQVKKTTSDRNKKANRFFKLLHNCPYEDRKDRVDKRVAGTCEWFTDHSHFREWKENKDSSLLWVSADPGCGKSVLSKYLVDEVLPAEKRTVCYFFFRDDYPDQRRSTIALANILHQIFLAQPWLLSDSVLEEQEREGERLLQSFHTLWNIFTRVTSRNDSDEIICVIDALDECQEDERKQLVEAIADLYLRGKNGDKLKFLLTSRPYGHIIEDFRELEGQMPTIHLSGEGEVESEKISVEINLVIEKRVQDISLRKRLDEINCQFLRNKFTKIPHRTYLWVTLTMDYVENLVGFNKGKVREIVLPQTVDDAYERILSKGRDHMAAKRLLHIVLAAKRPMSVDELSLAMALKREGQSIDDIAESIESTESFKDTLRSICGLMLVVVNERVYLLHQTVKEFLVQDSSKPIDIESSNSWKHKFSTKRSHQVISEMCIWHIYVTSAEAGLDLLLNYSALYWTDHFREACFPCQDKIQTLACHLCAPGSKLQKSWTDVYMDETEGYLPMDPIPLLIPAFFGLDSVIKKLLKDDTVEVDIPDSKDGQTALSLAAEYGHDTVVSLLLANKADIESKDTKYGQTPLSWAAQYGHDTVVSLLLASKANIESKGTKYGQTPLLLAARNGYDTVVSLLLASKADIDSKDDYSRTPLLCAAENRHDTVVSLLLDSKANMESRDSHGQTPLLLAARNGYDAVVSLLLASKADIDSKDDYSRTPLLWAAENGHDTVVSLLLASKADIESKDSHGQTPLFLAARNGYDTVVSLLLASKADIESKDSHGQTPLSIAAKFGYNNVVRLLLVSKADIDSKDASGRTPLSLARINEHHDVARMLQAPRKMGLD
ncbi:uncharacterized protein N7511_003823 [Penicillium nucicola]|uniref:uncharacterized protein n=1 Tax=Penicillium nucicola TaxID=1850975 RepID=UPI002544EFE6|nr:uncharacterized protein N7511_003823 [Penicillium nucicola]KAJ5766207.1 hypothetical protein N7511_003823 [Penicillium nucicola]